ncbi:MAG: DUF4062 domain-containing protein [Candidatus Entotheonellia bacterium]
MHQAQVLRIVVASPGDVQAERNTLPAVVDELNNGIALEHGLRLELSRWETDAYPGFHPEGPQGLIDPILHIEDCDILIGIFWKRFGTPVKDAKSGTEHEFQQAYEAWRRQCHPQIMVYFNQRAYAPKTKEEATQWGQVLDFQQNFPKEGLWWPYKGKSHFEKLVRNHLTQFIHHQTPSSSAHRLHAQELMAAIPVQAPPAPVHVPEQQGAAPRPSREIGSIKHVSIRPGKIAGSDVKIHIGHVIQERGK